MSTWIYPISKNAERNFELVEGSEDKVSVENYKNLVESGKFPQYQCWYITRHYNDIQPGDKIYIYAGVADQDLGFIGYATVEKTDHSKEGWQLCLNFDLDKCRMLLKQPISGPTVRQWVRYPRNAVWPFPFEVEIAPLLPWSKKNKLRKKPQRKLTPKLYKEGAIREINLELKRYRDPRLKKEAIRIKGFKCEVCTLDFEKVYGELGSGYIEVHHISPLSEHEGEQEVSLDDVAVVCANCHRVLHHNGAKPIPLEELRQAILKFGHFPTHAEIANISNTS
jgi:hypothetical protein